MPYANIDDRRAYQRDYYRVYRAEMRRRYIAAGLCSQCGNAPVQVFRSCRSCRQRIADSRFNTRPVRRVS